MPPKRTKVNLPPGIIERAGGVQFRKVLIYLRPQTARKLQHYAVDHDSAMSEIVAKLVEDFVAKQK